MPAAQSNLSKEPMKAATPYIQLHQRKRTWTPVEVSAGQLLEGGEEVILGVDKLGTQKHKVKSHK